MCMLTVDGKGLELWSNLITVTHTVCRGHGWNDSVQHLLKQHETTNRASKRQHLLRLDWMVKNDFNLNVSILCYFIFKLTFLGKIIYILLHYIYLIYIYPGVFGQGFYLGKLYILSSYYTVHIMYVLAVSTVYNRTWFIMLKILF